MTLVDADRVFHKAATGADPGDIPREGVVDKEQRDLTPDQERALRALSRAVVTQLELRRQNERLRALDASRTSSSRSWHTTCAAVRDDRARLGQLLDDSSRTR